MNQKKFILNADDFGMSNAHNRAILEGYEYGLLKSTSLVANGDAFEDAILNVIPRCPDLGVGIHLNIIEGKALCENLTTLTDSDGNFNNNWIKLLQKTLNHNNELFISEIEKEFRIQIESIIAKTPVTHIDSHVHVHAIPRIFELVCRLAKEYGIKQVRTQFEKPYIIPNLLYHLNTKYPINIIKLFLLNLFTLINENHIKNYSLKTNDYLIGVTYTSMMSPLTVSSGLISIHKEPVVVEAIIHPCRYDDGLINNHFTEFQITKNKKLKEMIENHGYEITNYLDEEVACIETVQ